jgi:hypothetical protein
MWRRDLSGNAFGWTCALAALWLGMSAAPSRADTVSYSMMFAENLAVLRNPTNSNLQTLAATNTQHGLMLARTSPFIELKNTSDTSPITSLSMTVGNTARNFDWAKMVEASPGVTFSLQSPDALYGLAQSDLLIINFTNFDPGDFVRFRVGLSPDAVGANPIVDYRTTFFTLNGTDTTNNSIVSVTYQTANGPMTATNVMPNYTIDGHSPTSMTFPCNFGQDTVTPFGMNGSGGDVPVPEPAGVGLAALGLAGMLAWRASRRRR